MEYRLVDKTFKFGLWGILIDTETVVLGGGGREVNQFFCFVFGGWGMGLGPLGEASLCPPP